MTKVLDDALLARAVREAERALAVSDRDTLAGRFTPEPLAEPAAEPPKRKAQH